MRVQVVQHVPFEGLGNLRMALEARHAEVRISYMHEHRPMPALDGIDLLIVLGGPMSVNDEDRHPWLVAEKLWLLDAIERGIPTLGICLGAQLIACALGQSVRRNHCREIGWFDLEGLPVEDGVFAFPSSFRCFHWHGDTYELPSGAIPLARSAACENQAFQYQRHVLGFQFHPETTQTSMEGLIERLGHELEVADYVQSAAQMRAEPLDTFLAINSLSAAAVDYLLEARVTA